MSNNLSAQELKRASALSPDQRYDFFVSQVVSLGQIWSLESPEGWVVLSSEDDDECLPIWSHAELAAGWATEDWSDCQPQAIPLDLWIARWTPGMVEDGSLLAVFPRDDEEAVVTDPKELLASLQAEMLKQGKA